MHVQSDLDVRGDADRRGDAEHAARNAGTCVERLSRARGMANLVVMFPSGGGHELFRKRGISPFQPLNALLRARGIPVSPQARSRHRG